jgi:hypothetical protein
MSDADDQMGGTREGPDKDDVDRREKKQPEPDRESEQSFPASDPPGNY